MTEQQLSLCTRVGAVWATPTNKGAYIKLRVARELTYSHGTAESVENNLVGL